jgi:potassium/hydrogen antiporter
VRLLGDFFVSGDVTVGTLGEIYGLAIAPEERAMTLAAFFAAHLEHKAKVGDRLPLGPIQLVADRVVKGGVATVGLDLAEDHADQDEPHAFASRIRRIVNNAIRRVGVG